MKAFDLFSKRQKRSRGEVPDVYQYKTIPEVLRVQIVHIIRDAFGDLDACRGGARSAGGKIGRKNRDGSIFRGLEGTTI